MRPEVITVTEEKYAVLQDGDCMLVIKNPKTVTLHNQAAQDTFALFDTQKEARAYASNRENRSPR